MAVKHNVEFLSPLSYARLSFSYFIFQSAGFHRCTGRIAIPLENDPAILVLSSSVARDILSPEVYFCLTLMWVLQLTFKWFYTIFFYQSSLIYAFLLRDRI